MISVIRLELVYIRIDKPCYTIKQSNEHNTICYFWSLATKKGVYAVEDNEFPSYNTMQQKKVIGLSLV